MAEEIVLTAESREGTGRSVVRKLRNRGMLPGVIYGTGIEAQPLALHKLDLIRVLNAHGSHPLVTVDLDGQRHLALVKEVQIDAVRQLAIHVDFLRVRADVAVHTETQIHLVGEPRGVKLSGGVLETQLYSVAIEALPHAIPESIELDISRMDIGDVVRVSDIVAPQGVTILTDPEETLATVTTSRVAAAAAEAAPEAEAEEDAEKDAAEEDAGKAGDEEGEKEQE